MSLIGKVVVVSGGSRGIGREIVKFMAERGAKVAFIYKSNTDASHALLKECKSMKGEVKAYPLDIQNQNEVKDMIKDVISCFGTIDVVVNNAGIKKDRTLLLSSAEEWLEVMNTNITGTFFLTQAAVFYMLKRKSGRIINISSISGLYGIAGQTSYSSSKAAIFGFTKALAKEVAPYGIAVNAIALGGVETDMVMEMKEKEREKLLQGVPLGRLCRTEEAAQVVEFLADDELSPDYMTGSIIKIDGGLGL